MKKSFGIISLIFAVALIMPAISSLSSHAEFHHKKYLDKSQKLMPYLQNIQTLSLTSPVKFSEKKSELKQMRMNLYVKNFMVQKTKNLFSR